MNVIQISQCFKLVLITITMNQIIIQVSLSKIVRLKNCYTVAIQNDIYAVHPFIDVNGKKFDNICNIFLSYFK
jgi:hypothetical protein